MTILGVWGGGESPTSSGLRVGKRISKENWGAVTQTQEGMLGKTLTAVPCRRGLAGPKEGLDVEGQGVNRSSANRAVLSSRPLTLVPSRPQGHDSAVKLPHAGFCNRPFPSSPALHWCVPGVGPGSCLEMSLTGTSSGPWEREGLRSPQPSSAISLLLLTAGQSLEIAEKKVKCHLALGWGSSSQHSVAALPPAKQGKDQNCFTLAQPPETRMVECFSTFRVRKWG